MLTKLTLAFSACAMFASLACAQTSCDPTLQALLAEVKQLRLALERSAVVAPKIQVTLQRIQLQQEQVSRLSRQLEDVRDLLARSTLDSGRIAGELKQTEGLLSQEQDPLRRKGLEDQVKGYKARMELEKEQQAAQETQQHARESELGSRLRTEQGKLDELNDKLNTLERMLESPQPK